MHLDDFDAILFDLDNTLVDRDAAMRAFLTDWLHRAGRDTADLELAMAVDDHGYAPRARFCAWWAARHDADADALWGAMQSSIADFVVPDPAIVTGVERLAAHCAIGIVTHGGGDTQRGKLRAANLDAVIAAERVIVSGEVGVTKPNAAIFELGLRAVGAAAERTLFVGDHPEHDIAGADAVGMHTCWISAGRARPPGFAALTRTPAVVASVHALTRWLDDA